MNNELSTTVNANIVEQVVLQGDLSQMRPEDRVAYYQATCESLGLNPLTRPFEYIKLNGKLTLYAKRDATDQLRKLHGVSVGIVGRERLDDVYIVTARATLPTGRSDESTGVVSIGNARGDALANALMKAETKAKRRVTLSIVGLGWLDETEMETIPSAEVVSDPVPMIEHPQNSNGKALHDFLSRATIELGLTDDEAKAILKELGRSGFKAEQAQELFEDLDSQINQGVTTETALLVMANRETSNYYTNIHHMRNAIKKIDIGIDYPPAPDEPVTWQNFLGALIEHASAPAS